MPNAPRRARSDIILTMSDRRIRIERVQNLWASFARSQEPMARSTEITPAPSQSFDQIGGLATAKDEILTYAYAATRPEIYENWGTFPPSGLLLIGAPGCGKHMLARALATHTETSFVRIGVPRLVLDMIHTSAKAGEFLQKWSQILEEISPLTIFFDELEFSQTHDLGGPRPDLPLGPIMDFLLELIDRTHAAPGHLIVGSTAYPDTLRQAFVRPGRLERVVEVSPSFPDDVIAALEIHAGLAESRAGRPLFEHIDWKRVVAQSESAGTGEWVRILHAVLRRKARFEAVGEEPDSITNSDLDNEVLRFNQAKRRIQLPGGGNYV